ncbi:FxDxF family PEP-CTERM protein [Rhizobacter sp. J219]|jgi:hypothetical protein|uniref:FxDxF family PEP-CTERM protein n=1 Tax=Rhizobacter sp. J219 TaxID=2898430 RepID=UPI0021513591|nr:FxDxF family PEP-CTERM protein [Rhizobacter sp. J219]MCR5881900.1 FxDxF family PEP-CTERM protein [Rhizobacter sp. J219]
MTQSALKAVALAAFLCAAGSAHADYTGSLGSITAPAAVAFANDTGTHLSLSSLSLPSPYNFIDRWTFALSGSASVTSLVAAFMFDDGAGGLPTFGISSLQVNLLNAAGVVVTGWRTVNTSTPFTQSIVITPTVGLVAGDYTLQVRGHLEGTPAAYAGSLIAAGAPAAVPVPATLPLLAVGLSLLGLTAHRRRKRD